MEVDLFQNMGDILSFWQFDGTRNIDHKILIDHYLVDCDHPYNLMRLNYSTSLQRFVKIFSKLATYTNRYFVKSL